MFENLLGQGQSEALLEVLEIVPGPLVDAESIPAPQAVKLLPVLRPLLVHVQQVGQASEDRAIHVDLGALLSRKRCMWKLPGPSVIWAQNSPMNFTTGLTRNGSSSTSSYIAATARISSTRSCRVKLRKKLPEIVHGLLRAGTGERARPRRGDVESLPVLEEQGQPGQRRFGHAIHCARLHFVGAEGVEELVHDVRDVEGADDPDEEVEVRLETRLEAGALVDAVVRSEEEDPKPSNPA